MEKPKVDVDIVKAAVIALAEFCEEEGIILGPGRAAEFAIAFRERYGHTWYAVPSDRFHRIRTVPFADNRVIAVISENGVEEELTQKLNEKIFQKTEGRWL